METTTTPAPEPRQPADVEVTTEKKALKFTPKSLRGKDWLHTKVPPEYHANGSVIVGPMKGLQLAMWLALDGLVVL
jgi:hypothetical protein